MVEPLDPGHRRAFDLVVILVAARANDAYALADTYRERGARVVLGGLRVRLRPWEALAHADSVVLGDLEELWTRIVHDAEGGRMSPVYENCA